ncbi:CpsD/CapB family tyrosine-protein kinase [Ornithinibacillus halotolerans]|uniref:non-specific protein-tyrosine kinase n=1 Tax=Ornithinibacillus halotolerans TaxID=1274357 RepID=A0A916W6S2_9BACI|nr:CpsD/CapB family tyrosine-protein kinase [Ornithinibacillus halotolerans]GGA72919.1 tyrosine protein kinase [Ornithinibacillus halotolerans]
MKRNKKTTERINLITVERKNKQIAEQFRSIRSNIYFAMPKSKTKTIVVTSPHSRDGKTMTAANLAIAFCQEGKKVLLVDTDLRRPSIQNVFRVPNHYGLSNYLVDQIKLNDSITSTFITNLDIVTSGIIPPNPAELLGSAQMSHFITTVINMYDVVIFDTPPILVVTDANLIANQCSATLLVVRAKKNEVEDVQKAKEQLQFAGANVIGAILNGKKQSKDYSGYY